MSRKILIVAIAVCSILIYSSCTKRGVPESCFMDNIQDSVFVGDTLYFMNCSKNYDINTWFVLNDLIGVEAQYQNLRHLRFVPTDTLNYTIMLVTWQGDSVGVHQMNKTFKAYLPTP